MKSQRRPWWKRKRWIVALVLWLVIAYELSFGPALYASTRGWIDTRLVFAVWSFPLMPDRWYQHSGLGSYNRWWQDLGREHAGLPPAKRLWLNAEQKTD